MKERRPDNKLKQNFLPISRMGGQVRYGTYMSGYRPRPFANGGDSTLAGMVASGMKPEEEGIDWLALLNNLKPNDTGMYNAVNYRKKYMPTYRKGGLPKAWQGALIAKAVGDASKGIQAMDSLDEQAGFGEKFAASLAPIPIIGDFAKIWQKNQAKRREERYKQMYENRPAGDTNPYSTVSAGPMMSASGGPLIKYRGPSHERGGIMVDANGKPTSNRSKAVAEVEGGETAYKFKDGKQDKVFVFSEKLKSKKKKGKSLSFADEARLAEKRAQESGGLSNDITKRGFERRLKQIANRNDKAAGRKTTFRYGGNATMGGRQQPACGYKFTLPKAAAGLTFEPPSYYLKEYNSIVNSALSPRDKAIQLGSLQAKLGQDTDPSLRTTPAGMLSGDKAFAGYAPDYFQGEAFRTLQDRIASKRMEYESAAGVPSGSLGYEGSLQPYSTNVPGPIVTPKVQGEPYKYMGQSTATDNTQLTTDNVFSPAGTNTAPTNTGRQLNYMGSGYNSLMGGDRQRRSSPSSPVYNYQEYTTSPEYRRMRNLGIGIQAGALAPMVYAAFAPTDDYQPQFADFSEVDQEASEIAGTYSDIPALNEISRATIAGTRRLADTGMSAGQYASNVGSMFTRAGDKAAQTVNQGQLIRHRMRRPLLNIALRKALDRVGEKRRTQDFNLAGRAQRFSVFGPLSQSAASLGSGMVTNAVNMAQVNNQNYLDRMKFRDTMNYLSARFPNMKLASQDMQVIEQMSLAGVPFDQIAKYVANQQTANTAGTPVDKIGP